MKKALMAASHPIMSCEAAAEWEGELLADENDAWQAMARVGRALGDGSWMELSKTRYARAGLHLLGLVGKGHNGGDALLAMDHLVDRDKQSRVTVGLASKVDELKPNTRKALDQLRRSVSESGPEDRLRVVENGVEDAGIEEMDRILAENSVDLCFDGLLGMQFKPPLREGHAKLIRLANDSPNIRMRVAVDLPTGLGMEEAEPIFQADVTFATGVVKDRLALASQRDRAGVVRYLDIGFFRAAEEDATKDRVLTDWILDPLRRYRSPGTEKRVYGHLLLLAGSRSMPGALAMSVASALRSGVGLVTAIAPESLAPVMAAQLPEAMWVAWPETPEGGLALEGLHLLRKYSQRASGVAMGPGMGREDETLSLMEQVVEEWSGPLLIDADAIQARVIDKLKANDPSRAIVTPHLGELQRGFDVKLTEAEACGERLRELVGEFGGTVVVKGNNTRVAFDDLVLVNPTGNAILARGGSGDILTGLAGGLFASPQFEAGHAAAMAAYWHGKAADILAYRRGQQSACATDLLDCLPQALQEGDAWDSYGS